MAEEKGKDTYTLKHPVSVGNIHLTELHLRRIKAKDLRGLKGTASADDVITILSRISGQLPNVIDELDIEDFTEVSSRIESFIESGRETGKTA